MFDMLFLGFRLKAIKNRDNFKPETRLVAMFKLCSYVLPKVIAVHQTENEPFDW